MLFIPLYYSKRLGNFGLEAFFHELKKCHRDHKYLYFRNTFTYFCNHKISNLIQFSRNFEKLHLFTHFRILDTIFFAIRLLFPNEHSTVEPFHFFYTKAVLKIAMSFHSRTCFSYFLVYFLIQIPHFDFY